MKTLKISFLIIGSVIGAGFASGKEIFEYFAKFGAPSLLFVVPLFFCFYFLFRIFLKFGEKEKDFNLILSNKKLINFPSNKRSSFNYLNAFMFLTFLILSSAMFSGIIALFKTYFPSLNTTILFAIISLLSLVMIKLSFKVISSFSYFLVPLIIVCIIINSIFSYIHAGASFTLFMEPFIPLPALTLLYASQNVFLSSFIIIKSGSGLCKREQKRVAFISSFILCLLLTLGIFCFLTNPEVAKSNMPFVEVSLRINPYFSALFGFIIFSSIITTYLTTLSSLKEFFKGEKKYNKPAVMLMLIVLLSLFDFGTIVEYLYPLIGVFGVIYSYKIFKNLSSKFFLERTNNCVHSTSKNAKNNRASKNNI